MLAIETIRLLNAKVDSMAAHLQEVEVGIRQKSLREAFSMGSKPPPFKSNDEFDNRASILPNHVLDRGLPPRSLTDGKMIENVSVFSNKPTESIEEFLAEISPLLVFLDTHYWVTMTLSRMSKVVAKTIRDAGILQHGPVGFVNWDEFKQYCVKRYHRPQHALKTPLVKPSMA